MIYVTHDQIEAMTLGDRIVVMTQGASSRSTRRSRSTSGRRTCSSPRFIGSPAMNIMKGTLERSDAGLVFRAGGISLSVDAAAARGLDRHLGAGVVAGVRPEHLYVAHPPAGAQQVQGFTVDVVEPLGNETLLHARSDGQELDAPLAPQRLPEPGERVPLAIDVTRLVFFDEASGEAIARDVTPSPPRQGTDRFIERSACRPQLNHPYHPTETSP